MRNINRHINLYQDTDTLIAYVKGELSVTDQAFIFEKASKDPILENIIEGISIYQETYEAKQPIKDYLAYTNEVVQKQVITAVDNQKQKKHKRDKIRFLLKMAASFLLLVAITWYSFDNLNYLSEKSGLVAVDDTPKPENEPFNQSIKIEIVDTIKGVISINSKEDIDYYKIEIEEQGKLILPSVTTKNNLDTLVQNQLKIEKPKEEENIANNSLNPVQDKVESGLVYLDISTDGIEEEITTNEQGTIIEQATNINAVPEEELAISSKEISTKDAFENKKIKAMVSITSEVPAGHHVPHDLETIIEGHLMELLLRTEKVVVLDRANLHQTAYNQENNLSRNTSKLTLDSNFVDIIVVGTLTEFETTTASALRKSLGRPMKEARVGMQVKIMDVKTGEFLYVNDINENLYVKPSQIFGIRIEEDIRKQPKLGKEFKENLQEIVNIVLNPTEVSINASNHLKKETDVSENVISSSKLNDKKKSSRKEKRKKRKLKRKKKNNPIKGLLPCENCN